jgi:hypothetical protein
VRRATEHGYMHRQHSADLISEAERYLAAIAVFRSEGRQPTWQPELGVSRYSGEGDPGQQIDPPVFISRREQ